MRISGGRERFHRREIVQSRRTFRLRSRSRPIFSLYARATSKVIVVVRWNDVETSCEKNRSPSSFPRTRIRRRIATNGTIHVHVSPNLIRNVDVRQKWIVGWPSAGFAICNWNVNEAGFWFCFTLFLFSFRSRMKRDFEQISKDFNYFLPIFWFDIRRIIISM